MNQLKAIIALVISMTVANAFAGQCVDRNGKDITSKPEVFQKLIQASTSCYDATQLAQACAWGSSLDVSTDAVAYGICKSELDNATKAKKASAEDLNLLTQMEKRCEKQYENAEGTLYMAMNASCHLSAIEWLVDQVISGADSNN